MTENQVCSATPGGARNEDSDTASKAPGALPVTAAGIQAEVCAETPETIEASSKKSGRAEKTRRSGRVSKEIPILLFGSDADGRVFTEETHTVVLSLHGAGIVSRERLIPEQELVLRWKEKSREADVRVVGEIAQTGHLYTYGVAFVHEELDFWEMEFPMAPDLPERPVTLLLECAGCRGLAELSNRDFEFDICMIHGGLTRYCDYCRMMTVWKQSHEAMPLGRRVAGRNGR